MISNIKSIRNKNKNITSSSLNRDSHVAKKYHVDTMLVNKTWGIVWALISREVTPVNNL